VKEGFYLSPCGQHIIEISGVSSNVHCGERMIIDFNGSHVYVEGHAVSENYSILLSCWVYLGEV
jgi:hypothetical protein